MTSSYSADELREILDAHRQWLIDSSQGRRADLSNANLRYADLRGANLGDANLRYADLSNANLRNADLSDAILRGADLSDADLGDANLSDAILRDAILRDADLRNAILGDAILSGANLRDANLRGANLRDADLWGVTGNMREIRSLHLETWPIAYTAEVMQIGCERHSINDWWDFGDAKIARMHKEALDWWRRWKPILRQIIEAAPAVATDVEATDEAA